MSLRSILETIANDLKSGAYPDEAAVSNGVVLRILEALDWPVFDTTVVHPQYPVGEGRVDFALCEPANKPMGLVEVKRLGSAESGERQLFEYAFHEGIPLVILTDGQQWHFYLPAERGDYQERRVYLLDLLERDLDDAAERLERYLQYDRACSSDALQAARTDYRKVETKREVSRTLPAAWTELVEEQDDLLVELLADKVESLCGYKPDPDEIARFLSGRLTLSDPRSPQPRKKSGSGKRQEKEPEGPAKEPDMGFTLHGETHPTTSARETLIDVFEVLCERDPTFAERMAARPKHGRKRRYIAQKREDLYPGRSDLAREYSYELDNGWWIGTNYGTRAIRDRILPMAAEVAGLDLGSELVLHLE